MCWWLLLVEACCNALLMLCNTVSSGCFYNCVVLMMCRIMVIFSVLANVKERSEMGLYEVSRWLFSLGMGMLASQSPQSMLMAHISGY